MIATLQPYRVCRVPRLFETPRGPVTRQRWSLVSLSPPVYTACVLLNLVLCQERSLFPFLIQLRNKTPARGIHLI